LVKTGRANASYLQQILDPFEPALLFSVPRDCVGNRRSDSGKGFQRRTVRVVQVYRPGACRRGVGVSAHRPHHSGLVLADEGHPHPLPVVDDGRQVQPLTICLNKEPAGGLDRVDHPSAEEQLVNARMYDRTVDVHDHHHRRRCWAGCGVDHGP